MRHLLWIPAILIFLTSCATFEQISSPSPSQPTSSSAAVAAHKAPAKPQAGVEIEPPVLSLEEKHRPPILFLPPNLDTSKPMASYDLPVTVNPPVQEWIAYFTGPGRKAFGRGLERSTIYLPMIHKVFAENDLPLDLAYLSLIESNYVVDAVSRARAVGLWQFMPHTARRYGLNINCWVDERCHPEKATRAAAAYLKDLHAMFGRWNLALAAYNAGEGKIQRALQKFQVFRFWEIADKQYLRQETRDFVPKFLAALILAKNPTQYGFDAIVYREAPAVETVSVPKPSKLSVLARLCGTSTDVIRQLNPHLRQGTTPVGDKDFVLRVPKGAGERFLAEYAACSPADLAPGLSHRVARKETLKSIARRYKVSVDDLMAFNDLPSSRVRAGQTILVPGAEVARPVEAEAARPVQTASRKAAAAPSGGIARAYYVVKPGDTPYGIARRNNLKWQDVASWNDIQDVRQLKAGRKLVLYTAQAGTALASDEPRAASKKRRMVASASARPVSRTQADIQTVSYKVRTGDTLWNISRRFNMEPRDIRSMNNLKGNRIRPGDVLTLRTERL